MGTLTVSLQSSVLESVTDNATCGPTNKNLCDVRMLATILTLNGVAGHGSKSILLVVGIRFRVESMLVVVVWLEQPRAESGQVQCSFTRYTDFRSTCVNWNKKLMCHINSLVLYYVTTSIRR